MDPEARTLPPDAALLAFYFLQDGTAVADFSEALATSIPSGIQSEQLAVDSIASTLEANVPQVQRLKILIHGQEVDTLAGHLDLTQTFLVNDKPAPTPPPPRVSAMTAPIKRAIEKVEGAAKKLKPNACRRTSNPADDFSKNCREVHCEVDGEARIRCGTLKITPDFISQAKAAC